MNYSIINELFIIQEFANLDLKWGTTGGFRRRCNFIELLVKQIKVFGTSVME